jgi:hypothetical protein
VNASVEVAAGGEDVVTGCGVVEALVAGGVVGEEPPGPPEPVVVAVGLVTGVVATT